jgi:hypothetical protein
VEERRVRRRPQRRVPGEQLRAAPHPHLNRILPLTKSSPPRRSVLASRAVREVEEVPAGGGGGGAAEEACGDGMRDGGGLGSPPQQPRISDTHFPHRRRQTPLYPHRCDSPSSLPAPRPRCSSSSRLAELRDAVAHLKHPWDHTGETEMGEGELERDGDAETEMAARCAEWMGCKEREPNLGHGTIDAIDGYRYGLPGWG